MEDNAVTVPPQTVMQGPNGAFVYVLDDNDTAHRRDVAVAQTQQGYSVIANGLEAGDRVVVEGQYRLTEGAKARTGEAQPGSVAQKSAP
jgi:multidrug efflux system membrane fusion protein